MQRGIVLQDVSSQSVQEVSRGLRQELPHIRDEVHRIVHEIFPSLRFANVWVQPGRSWYGDEVVDVWAIYDGDVGGLEQAEGRLLCGRKVRDMLWDRDLDVTPSIHMVTTSDAGNWRPEGF